MRRHPIQGGLRLDLASHAKAFAFDDDGLGVVQQTIEDGSGQGTVIVEHLGHSLNARFEVIMIEFCS